MADANTHAGGSYYTPNLRQYLSQTYTRETPSMIKSLDRLRQAGMPQINVTALDGKLLAVLVKMMQARKVVEIGTLSGYSALWMAGALPEGGHLWTIEMDPAHAAVARQTFEESEHRAKISLLEGRGMEVLPTLEVFGPFDVVFMDADKQSMPLYLDWARRHLRPGGLVMADNSFLFGFLTDRVPEDTSYQTVIDEVRRFHTELARDFDSMVIPTPEGLAIGVQRG